MTKMNRRDAIKGVGAIVALGAVPLAAPSLASGVPPAHEHLLAAIRGLDSGGMMRVRVMHAFGRLRGENRVSPMVTGRRPEWLESGEFIAEGNWAITAGRKWTFENFGGRWKPAPIMVASCGSGPTWKEKDIMHRADIAGREGERAQLCYIDIRDSDPLSTERLVADFAQAIILYAYRS